MKQQVEEAILMSKYWLKAAETSKADGGYKLAVYALEMALETVLKALLLSLKIEPPKSHNIAAFVRESLRPNAENLPQNLISEIDEMLSVFQLLLDNKNVAGYSFSTGSDVTVLKKIIEDDLPKVKRYTNIYGSAALKLV